MFMYIFKFNIDLTHGPIKIFWCIIEGNIFVKKILILRTELQLKKILGYI